MPEASLLKELPKKAVRLPVLGFAIRSSLRGAAALGRRGERFRDVLAALDGD
jgi:hypothetical protein